MGYQTKVQLRIMEILMANPICPPDAICGHRIWCKDPMLQFKNTSDRYVANAIQNYKNLLCTYNIEDYEKMYADPMCRPIFSAGYGEFETYYYNIPNSVKVMNKLIEFQFEDDEERVDFVTSLYDVLERKVPKLNTIVVHSPSSAGKNFFFDAFASYFINVGHLSKMNRFNTFGFQDAHSRRLVIWNEPNYSPEFLDCIKEMLGGDSTCVNVKYMADTPVYRTPFIVLTNNVVTFMTHPSFEDRIRVYNWKAAPFLKDYDKKPNPLAIFEFFKGYGLC